MKSFVDFLNLNLGSGEDELTEKLNNSGKKIEDMSPAQHFTHRYNEAEATQWHKEHPITVPRLIGIQIS